MEGFEILKLRKLPDLGLVVHDPHPKGVQACPLKNILGVYRNISENQPPEVRKFGSGIRRHPNYFFGAKRGKILEGQEGCPVHFHLKLQFLEGSEVGEGDEGVLVLELEDLEVCKKGQGLVGEDHALGN